MHQVLSKKDFKGTKVIPIDKIINDIVEYFSLLKQRILEAIENETMRAAITKVVTIDDFKNKPLYGELTSKNVYDAFRQLEFYEGN